jgi:ABC-type transport system involved in multi-copper enzyme maturation permease subunit
MTPRDAGSSMVVKSMQAMPTISLIHFGLRRLIGPLSDKELRVASRRGRSYALRSGYIVLLCILMLSAWYRIVGLQAAQAAFGTSRASVVSTQVATRVILFQFAAAQLVAALMLSSSIGDEMRRGTLGVLLTTPITSVHIVAGKLLGGLLQIVLLLGIGLPALAVLRVLGGLSWEEVFAAFWVTLTAAVFAASLSLLLSTYYRHSFQAISAGAVVYLTLFAGLPFLAACLVAAGALHQPVTLSILDLTNPFRVLYGIMPRVGPVPAAGAGRFFSWPIHCLIMAGAAAVIAGVSVRRVRHVAVGGRLGKRRRPWGIERLWGSPVAWKEDPCAHVLRKGTIPIVVAASVACVLLIVTKVARGGPLAIYPYYGLGGLWLVAFLRLAIATAGSIAAEKESGAWPVLLTTPLGARQILWGKVRAALRRDAVMLLSLLAIEMCLLFSQVGSRELSAAVAYVLARLAAVVLMLGAGLYFGVRLRTTTAAVTATLVAFLCMNYFVVGQYNPLSAWWLGKILANLANWGNNYLQLYGLATMGSAIVLDIALGLFLWWRARWNVRKYVF